MLAITSMQLFRELVLDIVTTKSHTITPININNQQNIPALVLNPGSEGIAGIAEIAGIAFSKPEN